MKQLGYFVTFVLTVTGAYLLRGWVLTILWRWFIVPTFRLTPLTLVPAIGVTLVIGYLTHQISSEDAASDIPWGTRLYRMAIYGTTVPLLSLLIGYVVHLFMGQ